MNLYLILDIKMGNLYVFIIKCHSFIIFVGKMVINMYRKYL